MRSFITRLIWLCILPPMLLACWLAVDNVQTRRVEFFDDVQHIAHNFSLSIDQRLESRINGLKMLADSAFVDDPTRWPDLYRGAQSFEKSFGTHVIFAQATGPMQMLFNTRVPLGRNLPVLPQSKGQAAAPLAVMSGRPAVGDIVIGPITGKPLIAIVVPVIRQGKALYLMMTTIETAQFEKYLDDVHLLEGWSLALLDGHGDVIVSRAAEGEPPGNDGKRDGQTIRVNLTQSGWMVEVKISNAALWRPVYHGVAELLAGLLAVLLIAVLVGKIIARHLVSDISKLLEPVVPGALRSSISEIARVRDQLDAAARQREMDYKTLLASEDRFTATFEQAAVGVALLEPDGRWLRVNQKLSSIVGYSPAELLNRSFHDITHPEDLSGDLELVQRVLAREIDTYSIEKRYIRKDGSLVWVNLTVALIWTAQGTPDYFISVIEDIDARKRAQDEVLATKRQLEAALASMTDAVFISDLDGRFIEFNAAFASFHKFSSKDECARTLAEYTDFLEVYASSGELLPVELWAVPRALRGETATNAEFSLRRKDTGESWIGSYSFAPIRDQQGQIVGAVVSGRDITERKAIEVTIRQSENRLRLALESAKAGTWEWDLRTQQNIWSDDAFRLYGLPAGSCVPSFDTWLDTIHPDYREQTSKAALEARVQAAELNVEWRVKDSASGARWLLSRGRPEMDGEGRPLRYLGIVMDITERKQAEAELEQHRNHLKELVASQTEELAEAYRALTVRADEISELYNRAPCGYHSLAADGVILSVNDTELELLGYRREEFVGHNIGEFMTPESRDSLHRNFSAFSRTGRIRDLEFDFICKDGQLAPCLINSDLVRDAEGKFLHTRSTLVDNSERKARDAQLRAMQEELALRAEEAEAATRSKSAFLANMSHEIRTPMNAIIGLTHLVQRAGQVPEQAERMRKIESAGLHLLSIINDILDISKIEAGRVELESTDFHLSAILDNIQSLIGEQARSKGLRIEIDPDSVPVWLRGDPTRLRQALLNYAGNAVKFTEHGRIILRAILLEDSGDKLLVRFEVQDTGIGIPPDILPALFNSFEQADASITRKYGGTGLGLGITRRLAQLMGGEADAESTPGVGSTFWFTARLSRGHGVTPSVTFKATANAEEQLRQQYSGARLLLAEDNEINCEVALELLHSVGLQVDTAINGLEAVAKAQRTPYALILMDMQMPEMDGMAATRAIRALPGWEWRPILAMTANAFADDRRLCEEAGMNDFISKPVNPESFFATLLQWLQLNPINPITPSASASDHTAAPHGNPAGAAEQRAELPDLPGIDTALGLGYVLGKKDFYRRLLQRFRDEHAQDFVEKFRAARTANDWSTAVRLAHTLKGLAQSIGASELNWVAGRLELAATRVDFAQVITLEGELEQALSHILPGLLRLGKMNPGPGVSTWAAVAEDGPMSAEARQAILERLLSQLESRDTAAVASLDAFGRAMRGMGVAEQELDSIRQAIARYDYRSALQGLHQLKLGLRQVNTREVKSDE
jgi:two-component system sensor histidine kinase/response regulator